MVIACFYKHLYSCSLSVLKLLARKAMLYLHVWMIICIIMWLKAEGKKDQGKSTEPNPLDSRPAPSTTVASNKSSHVDKQVVCVSVCVCVCA